LERQESHLVLILGMTLLAAWLRLWQWPPIPPGLEYDEAINGLDALWMLETGTHYLFVNSLHGREALFLYPVAFFIWLLGATPLALRLPAILAGIVAVPLLYRLTLSLFWDHPRRFWLAQIAAAGLTLSLWHIGMSRVALRVVLLPPFFTLTALLFWRGWRAHITHYSRRTLLYCAGAGLAL
jgi:4-amino-4-deoxy-L-arabinose transferase-like glycosyltransferase